ncbi:MAG: glycosyltransferase family 39 protein [bacterium]
MKKKKNKALNFKKPNLKTILISLFLLMCLHFITHLPNLTRQPLFGDEAIYIRWAQIIQENPKEWLFVPNTDGKQPFFMWLNAFLTIPLFNDPVYAGRLVSVLASSLTLIAIFILSMLLFSWHCAIFSALFYIFSPYHLFYSRMALVDTLLGTFAILTMLFTLLLMEKRHIVWALGIGICIGCAFLTKSPGMFLFLPAFLSIFIFKKQKSLGIWLYLLFAFVVAASLISINFFSPQKPIITEAGSILHHKSFFVFSNLSLETPKIWLRNFISLGKYIHFSFPYLFIPFLLFAVYRMFRHHSNKDLFLGVFSLLPMTVIALIGTSPFTRYYLFALLSLFIILGEIVVFLKAKWLISSFLVLPCLYLDFFLVFSFDKAHLPYGEKNLQNPFTNISGYCGFGSKDALLFLKENVKDKVILFLPTDWGCPSDYLFMYLKDDKRFTIYEAWWWPNRINRVIPEAKSVEMALSKYQQKKAGLLYPEDLKEKEVWFVTTSISIGQSYFLSQNPEFELVQSFYSVDIYRKRKEK